MIPLLINYMDFGQRVFRPTYILAEKILNDFNSLISAKRSPPTGGYSRWPKYPPGGAQ
jgi:hypothetical protein